MNSVQAPPGSQETPRLCVLVVEDDAMVGKTLEMVLGERYKVICVTEVTQALAEIAAQPVNVVLLDYYLRDLNGTIVAEGAERAGIPVVWMTGASTAMEALTAQGQVWLMKPFRSHELISALGRALRRAAEACTWRELSEQPKPA